MKTLLLGLLLTSFTMLAQTPAHSNLNTSVNDNGKTFSIQIDGDSNGKAVHYKRTFDVAGMSQEQKEAMKNRVLDSLGLGEEPPRPAQPNTPMTSGVEKVSFTCPTCTGKTKISISGNGFSAEREIEDDKNKPAFPFDLEIPPGAYRYEYRQNDVLQMQLPFLVKTGQKNTVQVK
ncbi:hypothetical protein [Spirosoma spitsbergense]|jgi:hypothetical protein|uniref:hypothetical protein n=1 Tax=Spirosoma spitsbergense TaxID=431554 RepID=UPI0004773E4B|nr:hypothetical protein [Spirosoma spitsbergense]